MGYSITTSSPLIPLNATNKYNSSVPTKNEKDQIEISDNEELGSDSESDSGDESVASISSTTA